MNVSKIATTALQLSITAVLLLATAACNKDNNSSGSGNPAKVVQIPGPGSTHPSVNQCLQQAAPQGNWWPQYNVQPYGSPLTGYGQPRFNPFPQGYICGCPPGYMPTCSQQGLLCMPMQHMNRYVITWAWSNGNFSNRHRAINPYTRWYRFYWGERRSWGRHPHPRPRSMPPRYGGHPGGRMIVDSEEMPEEMPEENPEDIPEETPEEIPNELPEAPPGKFGGRQRGTNCSIDSVAQMCELMPNQPPPVVNGMVCMPLAAGGNIGIWVRQ